MELLLYLRLWGFADFVEPCKKHFRASDVYTGCQMDCVYTASLCSSFFFFLCFFCFCAHLLFRYEKVNDGKLNCTYLVLHHISCLARPHSFQQQFPSSGAQITAVQTDSVGETVKHLAAKAAETERKHCWLTNTAAVGWSCWSWSAQLQKKKRKKKRNKCNWCKNKSTYMCPSSSGESLCSQWGGPAHTLFFFLTDKVSCYNYNML